MSPLSKSMQSDSLVGQTAFDEMRDAALRRRLFPTRLDTLPIELLFDILHGFSFKERLELRFVCPIFAEVCATSLATSCNFGPTKEALEKATYMAGHPIFSKYIETIGFDASLLTECNDFSEFRRKMGVFDHDIMIPYTWDGRPTQCRQLLGKLQYQYSRYSNILQEQRDILKQARDLSGLKLAATFPKLKAVNLYMGDFQRGGPKLSRLVQRTFSEWPHYGLRRSDVCSTRYFFGVMEALHSAGVKLESLKIGPLTCSVFEQEDRLAKISDVVSNLKTLDLRLSRVHEITYDPLAEPSTESLTNIATNGTLVRLLSNTPNLKELAISLVENSIHEDLDLKNMVGDISWPYLEKLEIGNFFAQEGHLIDFFARQPTLKHLIFYDAKLHGSWLRALPAIREATDFKSAQVLGGLINDNDESWSFSGREELGSLTGFYLCKKPPTFANPLTSRNMV